MSNTFLTVKFTWFDDYSSLCGTPPVAGWFQVHRSNVALLCGLHSLDLILLHLPLHRKEDRTVLSLVSWHQTKVFLFSGCGQKIQQCGFLYLCLVQDSWRVQRECSRPHSQSSHVMEVHILHMPVQTGSIQMFPYCCCHTEDRLWVLKNHQ